jgi:phosphoribosylaminoimidazole-succinocarboxamide synthase
MKSPSSSAPKRKNGNAKENQRELLRDEGGKRIFRGDSPEYLIQDFSANGSAAAAGIQPESGSLRNEISSYLFEYLGGFHIPTHYVDKLSLTEMLVRKSEPLPVMVRVWNAGHPILAGAYGLAENGMFEFPVMEHYFLRADGSKTLVNEYLLAALAVVSPEEFKQINRIASKTNAVLRALSERRRLMLHSAELHFGRISGQIVLTDEMSTLTCRFADAEHKKTGAAEIALPVLRDRLFMKA